MMSNRSVARWLSTIALLTLAAACGGPFGSPTATFETLVKASRANDEARINECYSSETLALLKEMEELAAKFSDAKKEKGPVDISEKVKDSEYEILSEKIDGDTATLRVRIDGKDQSIAFVKEEGAWKMDFSDYLRPAVKLMRGVGGLADMVKGLVQGGSDDEEE